MPTPSGHNPAWLRPLLLTGLLIATFFVYSQVPQFDFVSLDDGKYVSGNPHVLGGLTLDNVGWACTTVHASNWHPLTWISLMLDAEFGGTDPAVFHRTNMMLHAINAGLLFLVLSWMTRNIWPSVLVAALFAVHPLHVESVAWITERKDVLSTLFWILTLGAYVRYVRRPKAMTYAVTALTFALGLLAKPMLVTLPFVLLLLDVWPLQRFQARRCLLEKLPLLLLSAVSSVVTILAQSAGGAVRSLEVVPLALRVANAFVALAGYLLNAIWPVGLSVLYPYPREIDWPVTLLSFAAVATVTGLVMKAAIRRPYLPVGWFWYLGTLVPVLGLIQVGEEPMADRYTYVPLIGIYIIVAWGAAEFAKRRRTIVIAVALTALAMLSWTARVQTEHWRDTETLYRHATAVEPRNARALTGLGVELLQRGRADEAIDTLRAATAADPRYITARSNLAGALMRTGDLNGAVEHYRQALDLNPQKYDVLTNLGIVLTRQGAFDEAEAAFAEALRVEPDYPLALKGLGLLYARQGDFQRAVAPLSRAVETDPRDTSARMNLAIALTELGQFPRAESELRELLRLEPANAKAHKRLGVVLAQQGKLNDAVAAIEESLRLDPNQPRLREDLRRLRGLR